tara:strand:+ start:140 stop:301 length:162 start_codon:yes stop_codon:yes gene_type:complete
MYLSSPRFIHAIRSCFLNGTMLAKIFELKDFVPFVLFSAAGASADGESAWVAT